jgi:hypothetical protein
MIRRREDQRRKRIGREREQKKTQKDISSNEGGLYRDSRLQSWRQGDKTIQYSTRKRRIRYKQRQKQTNKDIDREKHKRYDWPFTRATGQKQVFSQLPSC